MGERRLKIGVSACLAGEEVRYDGQHKRDDFLVDVLGRHVELVPVCPEVELGLGAPREPMRLVAHGGQTRLVTIRTGRDLTLGMAAYAEDRVSRLVDEDLSGYVLKKDSPSCGMARVKLYASTEPGAAAARAGVGVFADALLRRFPHLPVEEEGRLRDPRRRESFIERIFAFHRMKVLFAGKWTLANLVTFHSAHKLALLAHSPAGYRELGLLVAQAKTLPRAELRRSYETGFMTALAARATPGRHARVLLHMVGCFRDKLDAGARAELLGSVDDYRRGHVPLIVPVTLVRHHARRLDVTYLTAQTYLDPHPKEVMLRNHV
ncbi:MAG TPA: DUF523 and DUF1722 domain-containing protein [Haliangiales bacterium]|nr:DUF523 and DUF1722 domain-containing protein [Haliangiales bacterium]